MSSDEFVCKLLKKSRNEEKGRGTADGPDLDPMLIAVTLLTTLLATTPDERLHDETTFSSVDATLFASEALPTVALVNRKQVSRCRQACSALSLSSLASGFESLEGTPFFYVGSLHERPVYSTTQGAIAPAPGTFFLSWFADARYGSGGFWKVGPDYGAGG